MHSIKIDFLVFFIANNNKRHDLKIGKSLLRNIEQINF